MCRYLLKVLRSRTHGYLAVGRCGVPVVLTLVGHRSLGCLCKKLDSRADNVLRPVGDGVRVQAWDKAAARADSFLLGFVDQGLEVAPQSAVRCHHCWFNDCILRPSKAGQNRRETIDRRNPCRVLSKTSSCTGENLSACCCKNRHASLSDKLDNTRAEQAVVAQSLVGDISMLQ